MKHLPVSQMPERMKAYIDSGYAYDHRGQLVTESCASYITYKDGSEHTYVLKNRREDCFFFWLNADNNLTSHPVKGSL